MVRKPHQPRFVRLSAEHSAALLGPGETLEPWMVISSGRFVAKQRVAMIGPQGRIDGVAVVGPVVPETIVSLAHTDEERLGLTRIPSDAETGAARAACCWSGRGEARVTLPPG